MVSETRLKKTNFIKNQSLMNNKIYVEFGTKQLSTLYSIDLSALGTPDAPLTWKLNESKLPPMVITSKMTTHQSDLVFIGPSFEDSVDVTSSVYVVDPENPNPDTRIPLKIPTIGQSPVIRVDSQVVNLNGKIYILSRTEQNDANCLFQLDPAKWEFSIIPLRGTRMPLLQFSSMCAVGSKLYIFGGITLEGAHSLLHRYTNDTYVVDPVTGQTQLVAVTGDVPGGRFGQTSLSDGQRMMYVLFGKSEDGEVLVECRALNLVNVHP